MNKRKLYLLGIFIFNIINIYAGAFDRTTDTRTKLFESLTMNRKSWGIDFSIGGTLNKGNVNQELFYSDFTTFKKHDKVTSYIKGSFFYLTIGKEKTKIQNRGNITLRVDYKITDKFKFFAFNTNGYNDSNLVNYRATIGFGPWYDIKNKNYENGISLALAYEHENFKGFDNENKTRLALRNIFKTNISETTEFGFDSFYVPALSEFKDFRVFISPYIKFKINKNISAKIMQSIEKDNKPKVGIKSSDTETIFALTMNFGK